jgi:MFS family permease
VLTIGISRGTVHRSGAFLLACALGNAGGVIAYMPLLTLLLPMRVQAVAGEGRLAVLTATVIAGALAASIANVAIGWLSDRAVVRGGGRRRWLAGGMVAMALGYVPVALATSPTALVVAVVLFQLGVNALLAPLFALMADEVPDGQKGMYGGLLALGMPIASAVSIVIVGLRTPVTAGQFAIVPLVTAVCVLPLLRSRPMAVVSPDAGGHAARPRGRDLALAWTSRLLVQVAGNVLSIYLLYYAESIAPGDTPATLAVRIGHLLTGAYLAAAPIAVAAGNLSDRTGRRKPFLFAAAGTAALGLIGLAFAANWTVATVSFVLYAIGSAVFLALHAGFAMLLLPDARHRGRDLGLLNLANTLPALIGPLLAWQLATPHDFTALMLTLAALTVAGGLAILSARGQN